ncbi:hypothetical protein PSTT_10832, partial [Puccinia striiformis]
IRKLPRDVVFGIQVYASAYIQVHKPVHCAQGDIFKLSRLWKTQEPGTRHAFPNRHLRDHREIRGEARHDIEPTPTGTGILTFEAADKHPVGMDSTSPAPSAQVYKDLFAGTIGGITQVLSGQPFDIIKVRLQSSNEYKGMSDAAVQIYRKEGFLGFYKGTSLPLIGIGACVSIQFGCLEASKRAFNQWQWSSTESRSAISLRSSSGGRQFDNFRQAKKANLMEYYSYLSRPVEHIRIRLQTSSSANQLNHFVGPADALKKIIRSDGILRGLYCGQLITVAREFHGYGMYFLGYEWLVERHMKSKDCSRSEIGTGWAMLYGAGAGYSMWLSSYHLDQIKTRIQTDGLPSQKASRKYFGIVDCVQKIYAREGCRGFLRGLTPTLIRSPLVNGATFAAFETTMRMLNA